MKITSRYVTPLNLVELYRDYEKPCCFHHQGRCNIYLLNSLAEAAVPATFRNASISVPDYTVSQLRRQHTSYPELWNYQSDETRCVLCELRIHTMDTVDIKFMILYVRPFLYHYWNENSYSRIKMFFLVSFAEQRPQANSQTPAKTCFYARRTIHIYTKDRASQQAIPLNPAAHQEAPNQLAHQLH